MSLDVLAKGLVDVSEDFAGCFYLFVCLYEPKQFTLRRRGSRRRRVYSTSKKKSCGYGCEVFLLFYLIFI